MVKSSDSRARLKLNPGSVTYWLCGLCYLSFLCPNFLICQFSSVTQSCPILCNSVNCSTPGLPVHYQLRVHPSPCLLSRWCHPTTSSSVVPFSSCPQSFPAWGSFQMSQLFRSGGQSIGVSASTSVLPILICSKIKIIKSTSQNCCKIEMSSYMSKCPSQWPAHSKHNINVFCHYCIVLLLLLC